MFGIFKQDPSKKLQKEYESVMKKAVEAQRNGKMELFANLSAKADQIDKELSKIEAEKENSEN